MKYLKILTLFFLITSSLQSQNPKVVQFPPELEKAIALSALPEHLREGTGIYLFNEAKGYELVKKSENGFVTMVQRIPGMDNAFVPVAYDAVGRKHQVKRILQIGAWIAEGLPPSIIRNKVAEGYKNGIFTAPTEFGISYMLSPLNMVPSSPKGSPAIYYPHYMIYAPNLSHKDLGLPDFDWHGNQPFINNQGPHGHLIIRLGDQETQEIKTKHKDLINQVEVFLGKELSHFEIPKVANP